MYCVNTLIFPCVNDLQVYKALQDGDIRGTHPIVLERI